MKYILPIFLAFLLIVFAVSADTGSADVARIHIIANSDSEEDIAVKLAVADGVSELLGDSLFDSCDGIEKGLRERLGEIVDKSNEILREKGVEYSAAAEVGKRYFERKSLGNSAFPEGEYLALTVTLGEGGGHNWWSVIFPDISLEASLAMGEQGSVGKSVIVGGDTIVKLRCLIYDFYKFVLTKH